MSFVVYERPRDFRETRSVLLRWLWFARLTWVALPVAGAGALGDALDQRSSAVANTVAAIAYLAWGLGLVALFAPRPWGLTVLRVLAPVVAAAGVVLLVSEGTIAIPAAVIGILAAFLALGPHYAQAAGNALAYGDETRFPLRIPLPLLAIAVPIAIALIAGAVIAPPLLFAAEETVLGGVIAVIGLPIAAFLARALHQLSTRWLVLVPAGVTLVDPLMLTEPVLIRRARVHVLSRFPHPLADGATDLRLGAPGGLLLATNEPVELGRRRGRSGAALVKTAAMLFAPVRANALLEDAARRRIPTRQAAESAMPPPSTTSPS
jgi:hypothetical protein